MTCMGTRAHHQPQSLAVFDTGDDRLPFATHLGSGKSCLYFVLSWGPSVGGSLMHGEGKSTTSLLLGLGLWSLDSRLSSRTDKLRAEMAAQGPTGLASIHWALWEKRPANSPQFAKEPLPLRQRLHRSGRLGRVTRLQLVRDLSTPGRKED